MSAKLTITIPEWLDSAFTWPVTAYRRLKYGYSFRRIYLGEGEWTVLDDVDYYRFRGFNWRLLGNGWNLYAVRDVKTEPFRTKVVSLHREIMNAPAGLLVDHRNNNGLDNRRNNLRLATHSQNSCNRRKTKSKTSSRFIGVCFDKRRGRWTAYIRFHGRRIWLGRFASEIEAALAYDAAARKYHGEFAKLNFPEGISDAEIRNTSDERTTIVAPSRISGYNVGRSLLMNRTFQAIGYCILFAIVALAGCIAYKNASSRAGVTGPEQICGEHSRTSRRTPPEFSRSNDMATAKITLKEAKAQKVWDIFREISRIPRCSKNEKQILDWLKSFAESRNLACRSDAVGNTVIELPATKGYENAAACGEHCRTVVLQSHVDMVCEKTPESKHDFSKDPIELIERDGWITADGTTLGADDGLGVSLALAIVEEKFSHPPIELLFTVDEETGLTGANALKPGFITGKYLINLDGEDESFIVGCAGGENTEITLKLDWQDAPVGFDCYVLKVSGLYGGHSGVDIDKGRANAVKLLTRSIDKLQSQFDLRICSIDGGKASNAIPRDAQAVILLAPSRIDAVRETITDMESSFKKEFSTTDPNLRVELKTATEIFLATEHTEVTEKIINNQLTRSVIPESCLFGQEQGTKIINLLSAIPTGVYRMSNEFKGTVETSNNLARVETNHKENLLRITTMQRSFELSEMDELTGKIAAAARQVIYSERSRTTGAEVKASERYPAWKPDTNSSLLKRAKEIFKKLNNKEPEVKVIHAGLEPAVIGEKFPGIEMISVGPNIENPHSPQERLNIASVDNVWLFLLELIPAIR